MLEQEISTDKFKILRCDRNIHWVDVSFYIRDDLSCNIISVYPCEIESIFFESLLAIWKPVIVGNIYWPTIQNNFVELLNCNMNDIISVDNEI